MYHNLVQARIIHYRINFDKCKEFTENLNETINFPHLAFILKTNLVFADILFIDLNLSTKEVATAQKVANERGEKLVVFPNISKEKKEEITKLYAVNEKLNKKTDDLDDIFYKKTQPLNEKIGDIDAKLHELYGNKEANQKKINILESQKTSLKQKIDAIFEKMDIEVAKIEKTIEENQVKMDAALGEYTDNAGDQIINEISNLVNTNNFSSVVISGHHSGTYFSDTLKNISLGFEEFFKIFSNKEKSQAIKSIHLWGCYGNTPAEISQWKSILPNLAYTSGWTASAPKQDKAIDHDFLYKTLARMKSSEDVNSLDKTVTLLKSVPNITLANASISEGNCYAEIKQGKVNSYKLTDENCPKESLEQLMSALKEVKNYTQAVDGYEDVPNDNPNTNLRKYFATIRGTSKACSNLINNNFSDYRNLINNSNTSPFLVFNKEKVRPNFFSVFADETKVVLDLINNPKTEEDKKLKELNLKCDASANRKELFKCYESFAYHNNGLVTAYATLLKKYCLNFPPSSFVSENIKWFEEKKMTKDQLSIKEKEDYYYLQLQKEMQKKASPP